MLCNLLCIVEPGDFDPDGHLMKPPSNHYGGGVETPDGHEVNRIYCSPSIVYAGRKVYAKPSRSVDFSG